MKSPHDAYIAKSPEFAQPILLKIQKAMRKACPDVIESIKWSSPSFEHHGIIAGMAAFKAHVNMHFWRGVEMQDPEELLQPTDNASMAFLRFEKPSDVPNQRVLCAYIKEAMKLNEAAASERKTRKPAAKKKVAPKKAAKVPAELLAAFKKNKQAAKTFEGFSNTNKKEYVEWITEAKREATREKRLATAIEWMNEGKPRNWRYMKEWR